MSWLLYPENLPPVEALSGPRPSPLLPMTSLWKALSLDPPRLGAFVGDMDMLFQREGPLSGAQVDLIAVVVSATNGCGYLVAHFGRRLTQALGDETLARAVALDYREANLAARDRVLLDYVVALTCEPSERKQEDIERVREYGFHDLAILRATDLAAFVGQLDRLASGLGIELEPDVPAWEFGAQR